MRIDVWSDVICPWCYIGKRNLETALDSFDHAADVQVAWHSYELAPDAPTSTTGDLADRLASKYNVSREQALAMNQRVSDAAAAVGLDYHLEHARPGNTRDAHRVIHLAAEHNLGGAMKERLLRGYFMEGAAVGDHDTLVRLATEVGVDDAEVRTMLSSDRLQAEVRADEERGQRLGVTGVPFFVVDDRYGVSGAQPSEVLLQVMQRAWTEARPLIPAGSDDSTACGADECDIR